MVIAVFIFILYLFFIYFLLQIYSYMVKPFRQSCSTMVQYVSSGVIMVRMTVRLSVHPSVHKLYLVRTITRHRLEVESPYLLQTCVLGYSQPVLKMEFIDLQLQGHFGHSDLEFLEIWLVRMITRHRFRLESPILHKTCILGYFRLVLKMEVIDPDLQSHFGHLA